MTAVEKIDFAVERFADIQMLRFRIHDFAALSLQQKCYVYCLAQATLYGRDIIFDQNGKHNLRIRKTLEAVWSSYSGDRDSAEFKALETYLKRVWFSNGIHHHYGGEKFLPAFSMSFLKQYVENVAPNELPLRPDETVDQLVQEIFPVIFEPDVLAKRVNRAPGEDLITTSACNFYENVTQEEVEQFYAELKDDSPEPPSWGLNSTVVKDEQGVREIVWKLGGKYDAALSAIVAWLEKATQYAENDVQRRVIEKLVAYYASGDLKDFDSYSIEWLHAQEGQIDFINGFIEVYGDPIGLKGTWEGLVEIKDEEATRRTRTISSHAQWFEDHSPVDSRFKKAVVKGVTAHVVQAAMLGGEEYPASAIGINLPNAEWIRARHGSKSVTISNLTEAYDEVAKGNGFREEFVVDSETRDMMDRWGHLCDDLHTDLHECLGHGSGQLLPGVDPDALKAYGNTIEEARADLFGLYYIADDKMVELGLLPDKNAYQANYYAYMMNGLMTQLVRIQPGNQIEEAHMRNRALIAHWALEHGHGAVGMEQHDGKTYVVIYDYQQLRLCFARLLAEIQRIKSEGDYDAARELVERYAVKVNPVLHSEVLARYKRLDIAPYKGFVNPKLEMKRDATGTVVDVTVDYSEPYAEQMMRYSKDYATLI